MHVIPRYFCVLLCVLINVYIVLFYRYIFFAFAYIESWSSYSFATRLFHSTLFLRFLASCTGSSTDVEWDWQTMAPRAVCDTPLFTPRHGSAFRLRWQAWAVVTEPKAYRRKHSLPGALQNRWPVRGEVLLCVRKEALCLSSDTEADWFCFLHHDTLPRAPTHHLTHVRDCLLGRRWQVQSLGCKMQQL